MTPALDQLVDELALPEAEAAEMRAGIAEAELKALTNKHVASFVRAIEWICSQPRSADEKLIAIGKLLDRSATGAHAVMIPSLRTFLGWGD